MCNNISLTTNPDGPVDRDMGQHKSLREGLVERVYNPDRGIGSRNDIYYWVTVGTIGEFTGRD